MKVLRILKSAALGVFPATFAFMFLVRIDEDLAGVTFWVLWPILSFGLWEMFRRQETKVAAKASSKPKSRPRNGKRLFVTALLAIVLAVILAFAINGDVFWMAFIPLWIALYYGWPIMSRRLPFLDFDKAPAPARMRPLWLRMLRGAGAFLGATVLAIVCLASIVVVPIALCAHRAQRVANSIHSGMTVPEVLDTAKDCDVFQAGSDFPWDKNAEGDNIPAMGLSWKRNGTYVTYDLAAGQDISLTESEAVERLHRKLHDGYRWRFSYTYINVTPMHVSFSVIFGPDGRVAEVTAVHGWD